MLSEDLLNKTGQSRINLLIIVLVFSVCIGLPIFWDIPGHWRLLGSIQNAGHSVLFFVMAICLARCGVSWFINAAGLVLLGIGIEVVQLFIGKDCDYHDVLLDSLGVVAGLVFHEGYTRRSLHWIISALVILSVAFWVPAAIALSYCWQWHKYPVLADFEDIGRSYLLDTIEGASYTLALGAIPGEPKSNTTLKMTCPTQNWPGIALIDVAPNWAEFGSLQLDVWLFENQTITLGLALRGQHNKSDHHDITRKFTLNPGANHLVLPLQAILNELPEGEELLRNINKVLLYCIPEHTRTRPSTMAIDNLTLSAGSGP